MDGYALAAIDTKNASVDSPVILQVIDNLPAGYTTDRKIMLRQAIRIMTGAPIPQGADAVLIKELTEIDGDMVKVLKEVEPDENIRRLGEDVGIGQLVLKKGKVIDPADIGMLAAIGKFKVRVADKPVVAVLSTGDELVGIDEPITQGKIRDVNSYTLLAQAERCGGIPKHLGIARDDKDELAAKIKEGLSCDILIISGGVSVGDYDLVRDVLDGLGVEQKIYKVAIKPGKPLTFGIWKGKPIFGLPGNVVASMVCFEKFIRPAILKMMGGKEMKLPIITAELKIAVKKKDNRRHFVRARVTCENGKYYALPIKLQQSSSLMSMVVANGLIVIPEEVKEIPANSLVEVEMLGFP
jgi:molybdopterin molybdotransferase